VLDGTRSYSYAELAQRVRRLASALRGAGVGRNDRVAFLAPNALPLLEAHFGVPMAGAVLVAINTRLSADEVAYILDHSSSRQLFAGGEFAPLVARVRERVRALRWPRCTTACKRARSVSGHVIVGAGGATAIVAMRRSFRAHEPPAPVNSNLD
jgi:acyl-CoA synthetase (AMP-forming)/AMP-acid ligase II